VPHQYHGVQHPEVVQLRRWNFLEVHASDDEAWSPEHVIVRANGPVRNERVIPLAAFLDLATPLMPADRGVWISTDASEGERILFLPSVGRGRDSTRARRLIVVATTDPYLPCWRACATTWSSISRCNRLT
jgi:hypothetical protein